MQDKLQRLMQRSSTGVPAGDAMRTIEDKYAPNTSYVLQGPDQRTAVSFMSPLNTVELAAGVESLRIGKQENCTYLELR